MERIDLDDNICLKNFYKSRGLTQQAKLRRGSSFYFKAVYFFEYSLNCTVLKIDMNFTKKGVILDHLLSIYLEPF